MFQNKIEKNILKFIKFLFLPPQKFYHFSKAKKKTFANIKHFSLSWTLLKKEKKKRRKYLRCSFRQHECTSKPIYNDSYLCNRVNQELTRCSFLPYLQIIGQVVLLQCMSFKAMGHCIKVVISYSTDKALCLKKRTQITSTFIYNVSLHPFENRHPKCSNFLQNTNVSTII